MRATCEFAEKKGHAELPYIRLKIYKTKNDITIKISDCGGGIPRASSGKIFNYMYSTAPQVHILLSSISRIRIATSACKTKGLSSGAQTALVLNC